MLNHRRLKGCSEHPCHLPSFARSWKTPSGWHLPRRIKYSSATAYIQAAGWRRGLSVKVLSTVAGLNWVCACMIYRAYARWEVGGRERLDLLSLHIRRSSIAAKLMKNCHIAGRVSVDAHDLTRAPFRVRIYCGPSFLSSAWLIQAPFRLQPVWLLLLKTCKPQTWKISHLSKRNDWIQGNCRRKLQALLFFITLGWKTLLFCQFVIINIFL